MDDIIITGNFVSFKRWLLSCTFNLHFQFALKQLGNLYVCDLLQKTKMAEAQPISSPMVSSCKLSKMGSDLFSDPTLYRSVVGALQYATLTRPEISFSVNKVCQFMSQPLKSHWIAVKRILRDIEGTIFHCLLIQPAVSSRPLFSYCPLWCWLCFRCWSSQVYFRLNDLSWA